MTFPGLPKSRSQRAYLAHAAALMTTLISVTGICLILHSCWWLSSAKVVSAEVIGEKHDKAGNLSYVVSYRNEESQECEAELKHVSSLNPLKSGQSVDILYRPGVASDVRLDRFGDKWGIGVFAIVWGAVCSTPFWIIWAKLRT